jgi:Na+/proline symporter
MKTETDPVALGVFLVIFALVTLIGFVAARRWRPASLAKIDEWGLGGRSFGDRHQGAWIERRTAFDCRLRDPCNLCLLLRLEGAGILSGTYLAYLDGLKPLHAIHVGPIETTVYTGLLTLGVNILVAVVVQLLSLMRVKDSAAKTGA